MRSILLATTTNDRPSRTTASAIASSWRCMYCACASKTKTATSASFIARIASKTARSSISLDLSRFIPRLIPAVSTICTGRLFQSHWTDIESRVRPGIEPAMTRSSPSKLFTRVDFPTFWRPKIASCRGFSSFSFPFASGPLSSSSNGNPSLTRFSRVNLSMTSAISIIPSPCSALIGIGSPKPARETSARLSSTTPSSADAHLSPSNLFAKITISRCSDCVVIASLSFPFEPQAVAFVLILNFRSHLTVSKRSDVTPNRASNISRTKSERFAASMVCRIMAPSKDVFPAFPNA
mmetsp:Transcript_2443/g.5294  ORF Transcript_2443/g.5294 Transcript_2443/m.5294 type:complete len:294 (-) Transcript_2443:317-1198(-)